MSAPCSTVSTSAAPRILRLSCSLRRPTTTSPRPCAPSSTTCGHAAMPRCVTSPSASTAAASTTSACRKPRSTTRSERAEPAFRAALEVRRRRDPRLPRAPGPARAHAASVPGSSSRRSPSRSTAPGSTCPGGRASYPSTVLMTAIPAQVAGVPEIVAVRAAGARRPGARCHPRRRRVGRRRRGVPGRRRAGHRRARLRHRDASGRSTSSSDRGTRTSPPPSARSRASSASTRSPGLPKWWSWPTAAFRPSSSPPISWRRPSTARAAPPSSSPGTPTSPTRSTPRSQSWSPNPGR